MGGQAAPVEDRFWSHVLKTDSCWLWTAGTDKDGYGKLRIGSRSDGSRTQIRAHRLSWQIHFGEPTHHVLHTCDQPRCVRPDHLYEGGPAENGRDVRERRRHPKRQQTHCIHGHKFTPENTRVTANGTRHCKTCHREQRRRTAGREGE